MKVTGTSDLGKLASMQKRAGDTRMALHRAALEMTTGESASRFEATAGNLTRLFALERSLDRNTVFSQNIALVETRLDTMQNGLGLLLGPLEDLAIDMSAATGLGDTAAGMMHASSARNAFADLVTMLNTQVGGLSLFAGTATDGPAMASADSILADLDAMAQGAATPAAAMAAISNYFAPGGGFYGSGFVGSSDDLVAIDIGEGRRLDYALRADNEQIIALLHAQALGAVVAGGAFAVDADARMELLGASGAALLKAKEGLIDLRSEIGISQNTLERAKAARTAERDTIDLARSGILTADPMVAASTYQALEARLDTIYTVTARLADLSFTKYMR